MQADVYIPFTLPKNVLIFGSVSAFARLSRSGFASRSGESDTPAMLEQAVVMPDPIYPIDLRFYFF